MLAFLPDLVLRAQDREDAVARIVATHLHRHGPLQYPADALAHGPGGLHPHVPDGREDLKHVGTVNLTDRPVADARDGVPLQAAQPVLRLLRTAPARPLLLDYGGCGPGEGGHAPGAAPLGERVAARAAELAVGEGLLAGLGQRDQGDAAESEFVFPAPG